MNKLIYLQLEIKRKFKLIPQILIGTIALSIVIGAIVFCAGKMLYSTSSIAEKKTIVFSSEDDSEMTGMIVSALRQSKSINSVCNVIEADYEDALNMVNDDNTVSVVIIPKGFMDSLMNGTNYPISIYFPSEKSIFTLIINELTRSAQTTLKSAQSGVYTLYDFYSEQNSLDKENEANKKLNLIYLGKAFSRDDIFKHHTITATGKLSITDYYLSSGIMLLILLMGCIFILKTKETDKLVSIKLRNSGIGSVYQTFVHIISIFIIIYALFLMLCALITATTDFTHISINCSIPKLILSGALLSLCSSSIICCTSNISEGKYSSILLHFVLVIVSAFITGAFIPALLLPDILNKIAVYLPTTYILNGIGVIFTGELTSMLIIKLLCYSLTFALLNVILSEFHYKLQEHSLINLRFERRINH